MQQQTKEAKPATKVDAQSGQEQSLLAKSYLSCSAKPKTCDVET